MPIPLKPGEVAHASVSTIHRKDGTPRYLTRYKDERGKWTSTSFESKAVAKELAGLIRLHGRDAAFRIFLARIDGETTFEQYARDLIEKKRGTVEPKTLSDYEYWLDSSIIDDFGRFALAEVTDVHVQSWVHTLTDQGLASKTQANRLGFVSMVMKRAHEKGDIPINPCKHVKVAAGIKKPMQWLEPDEFKLFLSFVPPHYQLLVKTLALTGLRWGEATALTVEDIHRKSGDVSVHKAWKKDKTVPGGWRVGPPKTDRGNRSVQIPAPLLQELSPMLDGKDPSDLVFTKKNGKVIRQQYFWEWVWVPARNLSNGHGPFQYRGETQGRRYSPRPGSDWDKEPASGVNRLGKNIRVHDLRHTFASWMLNAGVPFDVLQDAMGHESIKTTVDRYGHILKGRREQTAKVGAEIMSSL